MTDPTPTCAEVEAMCATLRYGCNLQQRDGEQAADMIQALRDRAEAAEQRLEGEINAEWNAGLDAGWIAARNVLVSRDWTDCDGDVFCDEIRDAIRALRRAAPTEGEA